MNDLPNVSWPFDLSWVLRTGNVLRLQIFSPARVQCSYRDWSINIVKSLHLCRGIKNFFDRGERVRKIGTDNCNITRSQLPSHSGKDVIPPVINVHHAKGRLWHISIGGIPLQVALKKNNQMPASAQCPGEGAVRSRFSIAPR